MLLTPPANRCVLAEPANLPPNASSGANLTDALQFPTTYDANGNICPSITDNDKITIGVGIGLCGLWLMNLADLRRVDPLHSGRVLADQPSSGQAGQRKGRVHCSFVAAAHDEV